MEAPFHFLGSMLSIFPCRPYTFSLGKGRAALQGSNMEAIPIPETLILWLCILYILLCIFARHPSSDLPISLASSWNARLYRQPCIRPNLSEKNLTKNVGLGITAGRYIDAERVGSLSMHVVISKSDSRSIPKYSHSSSFWGNIALSPYPYIRRFQLRTLALTSGEMPLTSRVNEVDMARGKNHESDVGIRVTQG